MASTSAQMFKNLPVSPVLKQIARLNMIAGNPSNAFKFGSQCKKVELILQEKGVFGPAVGLKRFWRQNLPVLKFHNYDTDFFLTRVRAENKEDIKKIPAKIIVHEENGGKQEVDCKGLDNQAILAKLVEVTQATPVPEADIPVVGRRSIY